MTWKRKAFTQGQLVEVQREPSYRERWEPATYEHPSSELTGWHWARLPSSAAPVIVRVGGRELPHWAILVPARRIRASRITAADPRCGSQGVDDDGHCIRCGLFVDADDDGRVAECPPGFLEASP